MRLQPIAAHAALGNQRYAQMDDILHLFHHHLFRPIGFLQRDIETEFVMNLHNHRGPVVFESSCDSDHRHLDDIRRRSLYGCIDGIAFGKLSDDRVMRQYIRQIAPASEHSDGKAVIPRELLLAFDIIDDLRESLEIAVNKRFCLRAAAIQLHR